MIEWLDSAYPPNAAQIAAAKAAGYGGWAGYFWGPNILNGWSKADFDRVKAGGLRTLAYCSGYADPAAMRAQSDSWAVPIALDDEPAIRAHGLWTQPWLDTADRSRTGQYGNYWYHNGIAAAFHVLAAYPTSGDPAGVDWWGQTPRLAGVTGWQFAGSHPFAGITVDASWFDDAIGGQTFGAFGGDMTNDDLVAVHDTIQDDLWGLEDVSAQSRNDFIYAVTHGTSIVAIIAGWKAIPQYAKWQAAKATIGQTAGPAAMTPDEVRQLAEVDSLVGIANALKAELDQVQAKLNKDLA